MFEYVVDPQIEKLEIAKRYKSMLKNSYVKLSQEDKILIRKAFEIAKDAHKNQRRKTGEPYIYHPLEVAKIVADEIGLGAISIAAALLHDVVEDSDYTVEDIRKLFGDTLAKIVNGLTKISIINSQDISLSLQSENYRKLLLTLSEDVRVILVKIADRLHNMRTLESMTPEKQKKIASETVYLYAPLAHRLGLYNIKSELEDLSLKYNDPETYYDIERKLLESKEEREKYIKEFSKIVSKRLDEEGLKYTIKGRPKSISSIYRKIKTQGVPFEEIYDKFAIRVIYKSDEKNEKFLAWKIYSVITDEFRPNPSRMRDWISQPRSTGYESLHITVIGPQKKWVEVQIRSERMDEMAEKGIAAHYKYKEGTAGKDNQIEAWISQIRELLENQSSANTQDLLSDFKLDLYASEIFIFTPKGDLKVLPYGATCLDFAYSVHSDVGSKCLGAKVNGKLVPLSHVLQSGDQVEIITGENQKPKPDWLDFVVTSRARTKIKTALNNQKKIIADQGKELLIRKLRHLKITFSESEVSKLMQFFKVKTALDLYYNIAAGIIDSKELKRYADSRSVFNTFIQKFRKAPTVAKKIISSESKTSKVDLVFGPNDEHLDYTLATCCKPIPGDAVFGFVTISQGIKVHRTDCPNAIDMRANYSYRIIKARWVSSEPGEFTAELNLYGIDRLGLINELTTILSNNMGVNMKNINFTTNDGVFEGKITLLVKNKNHLNSVIERLKKVKGIEKIKRQE